MGNIMGNKTRNTLFLVSWRFSIRRFAQILLIVSLIFSLQPSLLLAAEAGDIEGLTGQEADLGGNEDNSQELDAPEHLFHFS